LLDRFFAQAMSQIWLSYSADLFSKVGKVQQIAIAGILRNVLASKRVPKTVVQDVDLDKAYERVASFLRRQVSPDILGAREQFGERYRNDPELRGIVIEIDAVEREIEKITASRDKLDRLIREMFNGKSVSFADQVIQIETADHSSINLANLSSGEKHILKLFIEALLAEENSTIIDEPELSLHIDWQRPLIENMRLLNPLTQYILATHSPEIMADIADEKIFRL
jgi:hypothetical protein